MTQLIQAYNVHVNPMREQTSLARDQYVQQYDDWYTSGPLHFVQQRAIWVSVCCTSVTTGTAYEVTNFRLSDM